MPLTEQEKVSIRDHMGYLNVAEVYTFVLGTPAGVETQFLIEGAMQRVLESALPRLRNVLQVLEQIRAQKVANLENLAVSKLGNIELRADEQKQLDAQYDQWVGVLENMIGCPRNPFDKRGGGGLNLPVLHG